MKIHRYSPRIYKYSMRFRVPTLDQSDCSICYKYDLVVLLALRVEGQTFFHLCLLMQHANVRIHMHVHVQSDSDILRGIPLKVLQSNY